MPTVLKQGPYRFFFYAGDRDEPAHVHVERDDAEAKFWLRSLELARNNGFKRKELNVIERIMAEHHQELLEKWHAFFDDETH